MMANPTRPGKTNFRGIGFKRFAKFEILTLQDDYGEMARRYLAARWLGDIAAWVWHGDIARRNGAAIFSGEMARRNCSAMLSRRYHHAISPRGIVAPR